MRVCLDCGAQTDGLFCATDGMATIVADRHPTSVQLQPQTIFASRYRIVGTLGRGGMGAVYDALHTGTGQRVAIKTLLIDVAQEPQAVKRFFYEAKLTASLQHPNTIRVFDFGQSDDGIFYLVMERLQGETLGERLQRYTAEGHLMTESEAASIGVGVLRSLGEAHRVNLVHRDLKPGNIFLHDIGGGETVIKVLDFGIAKHNESHLTQTGTSLGTPSYMSPEQVMGQGIDGRSDLYSLGIVLYQCVTGKVPFPGESSYTVMMKQVHDPAPDLAEIGATSKGFAHIVQHAMAKKVDERYATAQALREALEPVARGETVQAPGAVEIEDRPTQALATGSLPQPPQAAAQPPAKPAQPAPPPSRPAATPPAAPPSAPRPVPVPPPAPAPQTKVAARAPGSQQPHPEPAPARAQSDAPVVVAAPKKATFLPILVVGLALIAISLSVAWWLHGSGAPAIDTAGADAGPAAVVDTGTAAPPAVADSAPTAPDVAPAAPDVVASEDADTVDAAAAADAVDAADVLAAADESTAAPDVVAAPDVAKAGVEAGLLPPTVDKGAADGAEPAKPDKPVPKKPAIQWKHVWEHKGYEAPGTRPQPTGTRPTR